MSLIWKWIKQVVRVEKVEVSLKPVVRDNHFIFSSEPSALNCPFPSSSPCTALTWSLIPPACESGQNGRRSSLRVLVGRGVKNWHQDKPVLFKLHAAVHWNGHGTAASVAARGISFWFFPICKIVSWYLDFFQSFRLLCSVYNYVITIPVNTASLETDLCRV